MSFTCPMVKCKICGFETSKCEVEARHQLTETIKSLDVSEKCREVLSAIEELTLIYTDDVEALFPIVIKAIDGKDFVFEWLDCMELIKPMLPIIESVKETPKND